MTMSPTAAPVHRPARPEAGRRSLDSLQVGRGIAAIAVVVFHAHVFFIPERLHPGQTVSRVFDIGYAGVEFFFVLSGFIMILVHRRDIGRPRRAARFMMKRALRILPFYWLVTLAMLALLLAQWPATAGQLSPARLLHSLALVPMPDGAALLVEVGWTLSHEFLFYALFCLLIVAPRAGIAAFALWILAIGALVPRPPGYPWDFLLAPCNLLFAMGMGAALVFPRLSPRWAGTAALCGTALFLAVGLGDAYGVMDLTHAGRTLLLGAAAAITVAGLAGWETGRRVAMPRSLVFLGDASFAIYLVHALALPVATRVMVELGAGRWLTPGLSLLTLTALAVAAGCLAHVTVERPMLRKLHARLSRADAGRIPGAKRTSSRPSPEGNAT
ncbi:acyltransferase family protein [Aquicoccus sp. SCR17]|nr:acyltransferase family protein [Carideicomes alvinocaridis]